MNIIARMWTVAEACSHEPTGMIDEAGNPVLFTPMKNVFDFGFIAENDREIVIAFRGTKGLAAWVRNFDPYPLEDDYDIHDGFHDAWEAFEPTVLAYVRENGNGRPVYCTGHSRGGALATLCAYHIAKRLDYPCSCVSFGAPAQGTKGYRDKLDAMPVNHTRVVYNADFAPDMPPRVLGFRHAGKLLQLPGPKWHRLFYPLRIQDHFYSRYTRALIKYSEAKGDVDAVAALMKILPNVEC